MAKVKIIENKNENIIQKANSFLLKYFNVLVFLAVPAILIIGLYTIIMPKYRVIIQVTKAKNLSNENEYNSRVEYYVMINQLKSAYEKIDKDQVKQIEILLPNENSENELYADIESLAAENGLCIESLSINDGSGDNSKETEKKPKQNKDQVASALPGDLKKVKINLELSGLNYNSFKNFLYVIENNLELMDIDSVDFSPVDGVVRLKISTYFYKTS